MSLKSVVLRCGDIAKSRYSKDNDGYNYEYAEHSESHNKKGLYVEELACRHIEGDGYSEAYGNEVCKKKLHFFTVYLTLSEISIIIV